MRGLSARRAGGLLVGGRCVVTRSGFPADAADAGAVSGRATAERDASQSSSPSSTPAASASQSPTEASRSTRSCPAGPRCPPRRRPGPPPGPRADPRPPAGHASAANSEAWTSLSTPGGRDGHVGGRGEEHGQRHQDRDGEAPRASAPWTPQRPARRTADQRRSRSRLAVRADDGQAGLAGANSSAATARTCVLVDGVEPGEHLAHRQVLAVGELALAQPAHPRAGVLQAEHQPALELAAAAG